MRLSLRHPPLRCWFCCFLLIGYAAALRVLKNEEEEQDNWFDTDKESFLVGTEIWERIVRKAELLELPRNNYNQKQKNSVSRGHPDMRHNSKYYIYAETVMDVKQNMIETHILRL
jgi:hypothetical protein